MSYVHGTFQALDGAWPARRGSSGRAGRLSRKDWDWAELNEPRVRGADTAGIASAWSSLQANGIASKSNLRAISFDSDAACE